MSQSPAALRIHTNRRTDFDSYFPVEEPAAGDGRPYDADFASLPFPAPLASLRQAFKAPDFRPDDFLVRHQRHGALDDLVLELRALSASLDGELAAGVEGDYAAFIHLGRLDGDKVTGLRRGVVAVVDQVRALERETAARLGEVEATLRERRALRSRKQAARSLLRVSRGLDALAHALDEEDDHVDGGGLDDLEVAVLAHERLVCITRRHPLPEWETVRYGELRTRLREALDRAMRLAKGAGKLDVAHLVRRSATGVEG